VDFSGTTIYGHIHSLKFDGYPPFDRLHKIQYTSGNKAIALNPSIYFCI
jgi:hypothetical protein